MRFNIHTTRKVTKTALHLCLLIAYKNGSIINVGVTNRAYEKYSIKVKAESLHKLSAYF